MELTTTKCAAMGCEMAVSSDFLMCRRHWQMVPKPLQEAIWEAHHAKDRAQHLTVVAQATEIVRSREVEIGRRCRSCNAAIFYALSVTNQRPMPIDAVPVPGGNVLVRQGKKSTQLYAKVAGKSDGNGDGQEERYTSHFATCPQASEWRKAASGLRQRPADAKAADDDPKHPENDRKL